jgi:tetratricopeptide (TPR) repeat protein
MVVSDHDFHSDRLLPDYIPAEAAGPAVEHRHFGIFCLSGPGVRRGETVYGASVLDVTPTVLHLFGLPAARDMDGKPLVNAFADPTLPKPVRSWDEIPGEDGRHPPDRQYDAAASAESLRQLVALGYIAPLAENARQAVDDCLTEARYNVARSYVDAGRPDLAAGLLRELIDGDPEQGRFYEWLAHCLLQQGQRAECARLLDEFDEACGRFAPRAAEELKRRWAERPDDSLSPDRDSPDRKERHERRQLAEKARGHAGERMMLRCRLALAEARTPEKKEAARALLEAVAKQAGRRVAPAQFLAEGFAAIGDGARALEFVRRLRRADPDNWGAMAMEARIHYTAGRYTEALECASESLSLIYFQPLMHHLLGLCFRRLDEPARAEEAFRIALSQAPGLVPAHDELVKMLRRDPARLGEAALHAATAADLRKRAKRRKERRLARTQSPAPSAPAQGLPAFERVTGEPPADRSGVVTVVTGLPRSGTSMMMQMLAAAGIPAYTDDRRPADQDNPRGYFEHEQATRLHQDASWVPAARAKAVKIVAHLLPHLPAGEDYRVVYMHRDLEEVVASQRAMLKRLGRQGGRLDDHALMRAYTRQLVHVHTWLKQRPEIQVLAVSYAEALRDPRATATRLAGFLGRPFDMDAALATVDQSLRHQKQSDSSR